MDLKSIFIELLDGGKLVLSEVKNQSGENVKESTIEFEQGEWLYNTLSCKSSYGLGMGNCACINHPIYSTEVISRMSALLMIKEHMEVLARDCED